MILQNPLKEEYDFNTAIEVDIENKGFTPEEMQKLAGSQKAIPGAKGIDDIWNRIWKKNRAVPPAITKLKSEFGYQTRPLLTDLIKVAKIQNTKLDGQILALSSNYNFFVMRCGVYMLPADKEKFEALKFKVSFKDENVSTYNMLPGAQSENIFEMGGKADIGINGKVDFGFPDIPLASATVDANAKAKLETNFIVSFNYELKTQLVDAFGAGTSFCSWMMHKGKDLRNDVVFYPIIMAPKSVTAFDCKFEAYFEIDHPNWKNPEFFLKSPKTIRVSV